MTQYRCVNDLLGYCSDHPRIRPRLSQPNPDGPTIQRGGLCTKNLTKCGFYVTNTQKCLTNPHKSHRRRTKSQNKAVKKGK